MRCQREDVETTRSNRYVHTGIVVSIITDEVLKKVFEYSPDCLHNYIFSSTILLQKYCEDGINTNLINEQ